MVAQGHALRPISHAEIPFAGLFHCEWGLKGGTCLGAHSAVVFNSNAGSENLGYSEVNGTFLGLARKHGRCGMQDTDRQAEQGSVQVQLERPLIFVLTAGLLLLALISGINVLYSFLYAMLGLIALCYFWTTRNIRNLSVERQLLSKWATLGDEVVESFRVSNAGALPVLWVEVNDHSDVPGYEAGIVTGLGPREHREWKTRAVCSRRGLYRLGPLRVYTGDPFGIFRATKELPDQATFLVYPPITEVPGLALPTGRQSGESRSLRRALHLTTDAASVREYVPGDSLHIIHWPTTARRGRLQSKEFDMEPGGSTWILLDLDQAVQAGEEDESTEEYSVKLAAALVYRLIREQKSIGLITYGDENRVLRANRGSQHMWRIMEILAVVRAHGTAQVGDVLSEVAPQIRGSMSLFVVTPSTDPTLVPILVNISRRGIRPTVLHLEPETFGAAGSSVPLKQALAAAGISFIEIERGQEFRTIAMEKGDEDIRRRAQTVGTTATGRVHDLNAG